MSQKEKNIIYSCQLRPSDGFISDWRIETQKLFNKFIIFKAFREWFKIFSIGDL